MAPCTEPTSILIDDFICPNCVSQFDAIRHTNSCSQCNESYYLIQDVHRVIELLRFNMEKDDDGTCDMLLVQLEIIQKKLKKYIAHLVRDNNQEKFKQTVINNMGIHVVDTCPAFSAEAFVRSMRSCHCFPNFKFCFVQPHLPNYYPHCSSHTHF
mmetsp:Transcript_39961/g.51494  ORF Transcript_39961/g.51494 Transcript_39961/m.51494 type:complete len:155 (-) Transcript_39961:421-885(-)